MVWPTLGSRKAKEQNRTDYALSCSYVYFSCLYVTAELLPMVTANDGHVSRKDKNDWVKKMHGLQSGGYKTWRQTKQNKNSSGDEIANANFRRTTTYM